LYAAGTSVKKGCAMAFVGSSTSFGSRDTNISSRLIDYIWSLAAGAFLLAKGIWDNRSLFGQDVLPLEDAAADILLSEKMHHGLLLTGH
jgi:hypothetical protein